MRASLVATGMIVFLTGCAGVARDAVCGTSGPAALEQSGSDRLLNVLHVRSTIHPASGFPITPSLAITAAHVMAPDGLAAVESLPMVMAAGRRRRPTDAETRHDDDWAILGHPRERFTPDVIDPDVELKPGDKVLIGGFFVGRDRPTDAEFWLMEPAIVQGRVVERPSTPKELEGLVWVQVPFGDYRGFSGGPAAWVDADGVPRVWGLMSYHDYICWGPIPVRRILGIVRLPKDVLEHYAPASRHTPPLESESSGSSEGVRP